ncbi:hypothetical protein [Parapedobacter tibetensis]|uniref:hypothetical protein n=1 Tax=Parapedobacter tibetensis TaxID=2972951 RepID=UPI00214D1D01|nr:hypothetical protein [Parapedobacter tibetensis]
MEKHGSLIFGGNAMSRVRTGSARCPYDGKALPEAASPPSATGVVFLLPPVRFLTASGC